jgi:hypothetical protein
VKGFLPVQKREYDKISTASGIDFILQYCKPRLNAELPEKELLVFIDGFVLSTNQVKLTFVIDAQVLLFL